MFSYSIQEVSFRTSPSRRKTGDYSSKKKARLSAEAAQSRVEESSDEENEV